MIINFNDISIHYQKRMIIKDFSASIKTGEFIGVLGANGAGKSTLLRAILGKINLSNGYIDVLGKPAQRGNPRIGYMPQIRHTPHHQFSGRARLAACFSSHRYGLPLVNKHQRQRIDEVIAMVNADQFADRSFSTLSGGERQRLLLAQALLNDPDILLLDEPLAGLDPKQQLHLMTLVKSIQTRYSKTILLTAHDINIALPALQRVIYLANGKCKIGTTDEVINTKALSELYNANIEVVKYQNRILILNHEDPSLLINTDCIQGENS